MLPVTSGHRVTITYNLYYADDDNNALGPSRRPVARPVSTNEQTFKDALRGLLDSPMFLPNGGNLMFGLTHQYPLAKAYPTTEAGVKALKDLEPRLKASDALIMRVLRECSLDASLKIVYEAQESPWSSITRYVMCDGVIELPSAEQMIHGSAPEYIESEGGQLIDTASEQDDGEYIGRKKAVPVHWVTDHPLLRTTENGFEETIQTYGNEPTVEVVYWRIWIFVRVGPKDQRTVAGGAS